MTVVVLAPVPCIHLRSAQSVPGLSKRVAFASNQDGVPHLPIGLQVFIYASDASEASAEDRRLLVPGKVSWTGKLGAIVEAVKTGRRAGRHADPSIRPPTAEANDTPVMYFWEVLDLMALVPSRPLSDFKSAAFPPATVPRWPVMAELTA
jgi:hypothetical protein